MPENDTPKLPEKPANATPPLPPLKPPPPSDTAKPVPPDYVTYGDAPHMVRKLDKKT